MIDFDRNCQKCDRLVEHLSGIKIRYPDYYCAPVPAFGDHNAKFLIVGLAPGMHGANRSGRPFTGDDAGELLYRTIFDCGLSTAPVSISENDDLQLINARITNAVKCLPPQNKPNGLEVRNCNPFLANEINVLDSGSVIFALGGIAHNAVLRALGLKQSLYKFAHAAQHTIDDKIMMVDSYHCSRYNTQTKRLTPEMFFSAMQKAVSLVSH